jgi:3-deoxy-D-manno-octulosonate 8-phosphate phosphatase (KDO 8-P phosphatase)
LNLDLLILDFDGVLTDNRVYVSESGEETVACHRGDGWGIKLLKDTGLEIMIISTESNPVVSARAKKLGVKCVQNCSDKNKAVRDIMSARNISLANVMYVGNDTNDQEAMISVGYPVAPADAHPDIRSIAKIITRANGGYGVIRELAEILLNEET